MFGWSKVDRHRRRIIRDDRKYLEARVRRFLQAYLSASNMEKDRYYEVVAGASAGCLPEGSVQYYENFRLAEITAETANAVVRRRLQAGKDGHNDADRFVTEAFATTAVAYRRAAGIYADDRRMQELGTAAVHLLTMATSRFMAKSRTEQKLPLGEKQS